MNAAQLYQTRWKANAWQWFSSCFENALVSLYPPPESLRVFAAEQGHVTLTTTEGGRSAYPRMQVLGVEEMLRHGERPKLTPVDPRSLLGDAQTRLALTDAD